MKKSSKAFLALFTLALTFGVAASITEGFTNNPFINSSSEGDPGIIVEPGTDLNASEIKMKNIGDTFNLKATINDDASIKSVEFTSSDPTAISITSVALTSCTLTKLKDFPGVVTITAKSDDPFVDLSATCKVRSYNSLISCDSGGGYVSIPDCKDEEGNEFDSEDFKYSLKLKLNYTYTFAWHLDTKFAKAYNNHIDTGVALTDNGFLADGTFIGIEDEDAKSLIKALESSLNTTITNVYQRYDEENRSTLVGTFKYTNEINSSLIKPADELCISSYIAINVAGLTLPFPCEIYSEANSLELNASGTLVL